uniref:Uncharacterized protein n=1 Tax=Rousettus aegyptiacus TaxID=9407 RepID=A0A7J8H1J9_ROUAE|nr:hypothetical protein HJG63_011368 [Rousettus aegyptiacus]
MDRHVTYHADQPLVFSLRPSFARMDEVPEDQAAKTESCSASQTSPPELTCASQEKAALPAAVARRPSLLTWTSAAHRPAALAMHCCRHTDLSYFLRIFSGWSVCLCVFMRVCECVRVYVCVCVCTCM